MRENVTKPAWLLFPSLSLHAHSRVPGVDSLQPQSFVQACSFLSEMLLLCPEVSLGPGTPILYENTLPAHTASVPALHQEIEKVIEFNLFS